MTDHSAHQDATDGPGTLPQTEAQRLAISPSQPAIERASSAPPNVEEEPPGLPTSLQEASPSVASRQAARTTLSYPSPNFQSKTNQKPFSHSAAKRESVMALGSIAGFQRFYARQGLAAASPPMATKGGRLALGPAAAAARGGSLPPTGGARADHHAASTSIGEESAGTSEMSQRGEDATTDTEAPRSTWKGKLFPDVARPVEADLEELRRTMTGCLQATRQEWHLMDQPANADTASCVDIASLVACTIGTIRAVRSYFLALPPQSLVPAPRKRSGPTSSRLKRQQSFRQEGAQPKPRDNFKRQSMSHVLTRRASTVLLSSGFAAPAPERSTSGRRSSSRAPSSFFPFQTVRRLSFAPTEAGGGEDLQSHNLARDIRNIFAATEAMTHAGTGAASITDFHSERSASPTNSDDEEGTGSVSGADPLVLIRAVGLEVLGMLKQLEDSHRLANTSQETDSAGDGVKTAEIMNDTAQYRTDVALASLTREREVVRIYIAEVEGILSRLPDDARKRERDGRAASYSGGAGDFGLQKLHLGGETEAKLTNDAGDIDFDRGSGDIEADSSLPHWAQRTYDNDNLERARAILCDVLPAVYPELRPTVETDQLGGASQEQLLMVLSDGQLLCHAFNAALRRSRKPWGFIPSASIHDVRSDEDQRIPIRSRSVNASYTGSTGRHTPSELGDEMDSASASLGDVHRKPGWTFRRVENLNKFTVAIGLRYGIKGGSAKPTTSRRPSGGGCDTLSDGGAPFDAVKVVRQEGSWQEMLRGVVEQWALSVAEEERNR